MKFEKTVIDSHMHVKVLKTDEGVGYFDFFDELQKEHGLKGLNICSTTFYNGPANNIMAALYKLHNPTAYAYGGFFYPEAPAQFPLPAGMDLLTQYNDLMNIGFDGIKLIEIKPNIQKKYGFNMSDGSYDAFFEKCQADRTHIVWHVGDPETFWDINKISPRHLAKGWFWGADGFLSLEEIYSQVYAILERFPKLKITFAHFFFYSYQPERLIELFEKYENVGVDITPGAEMFGAFRENREFYRKFFIKYADRITYGTDTICGGSKSGLTRLDNVYKFVATDEMMGVAEEQCAGMNFPEDVCEKILHKNFEKVAGGTPKAINKVSLRDYIEKYRVYVKDEQISAFIEEKSNNFGF